MAKSSTPAVVGKDGLTGVLLDPPPARAAADDVVRVELDDGRVVRVPADMLVLGSDGTYLMPIGPDDLHKTAGSVQPPSETPQPGSSYRAEPPSGGSYREEGVIPVLAEELVVGTRPVPTGGVRVHRRVLEHEETVEVPLRKEHVDVRRVLIDREVAGPLPVRREGDLTIIPIVEEELVVEKRYRLKEEIHVSRTVREEVHRERVTVGRQEADIEHVDADGRTRPVRLSEPAPPQTPRPARAPSRRRSILGDD